MHKVHQNIVIDGVDWGDSGSRKLSAFCNEGKWNNFILPLLPKDPHEMTFVEYGSNAGLYLAMADDYGFDHVVGFESDRRAHEMAERYKQSVDKYYKTLHETFSESFDFNKLPIADVTLLANFHYHIPIVDFVYLLDNLKYKTVDLLIVSVEDAQNVHWRPPTNVEGIRQCMADWEEVGYIPCKELVDPHPRNMFSLLFRSKLRRRILNDLVDRAGKPVNLGDAFNLFIQNSVNDPTFDYKKSLHYKKVYFQKEKKWSIEQIDSFVENEMTLMRDLEKHGMKKPVLINEKNIILDGDHRINFLLSMGYKTVIKRKIENYG
jgi:hypothetical protein